jgi:hypothetical protein
VVVLVFGAREAVAVVVLVAVRGILEGMRVVGGEKVGVAWDGVSEGSRSSAGKVEECGVSVGRWPWDPLAIGRSESGEVGGIDGVGTSKRIGR